MMEYTKKLAEFVAETNFEDLPPEVLDRALTVTLDSLSCAVAGSVKSPEECKWIVEFAKTVGGKPESTIWTDGYKTSAMTAAMANATMAHTIDFDDTHLESVAHLGACLLGTVLSLGEKIHAGGKDVIAAFALGFEVAARVGNAVNKGAAHHHYKYWHPTATCGTVGCSAAAAKLLKLDAEKTEMAIGLGVDQAAGLRYCIDKGDFSKSLHQGWSAMRGVMSAQIIAVGANGPKGLLEYPTGFCAATCPEPRLDYLVDGLGVDYAVMKDAIKMYPTIHCSHPGIEAALKIVTENDLKPEDIARIFVATSPFAKGQGVNYEPSTVLAARLSIPCCIAVAVFKRRVSLDDFTEELIREPEFVEFMKKVKVEPRPEFNELYPRSGLSGESIIVCKDGREYKELVVYCKGHPERPASKEDIAAKYFDLATVLWPREKARRVYDFFGSLAECGDVAELIDLMLT